MSTRLKSLLALLLFALLLLWWLWRDAQRFLDAPLAAAGAGLTYAVAPGSSLQRVAADLHAAGLLARPQYFTLYARYSGDAARLKAGEYQIDASLTPRELLALLVAGRVVQHGFTIVEGWNIRELLAAIAADPVLRQTLPSAADGAGAGDESAGDESEGKADETAADDPFAAPAAALMAAIGRPGQHPEGRFLPDTYHFPRGTSDVEFLRRAARAMDQTLAELWPQRDEGLPLESPEQALILASIVEKETGLAEERPMIAGVFVSRLRKGMKLQTDPTVIYGIGAGFDGDIRRRDLRTDTPYNTYTRKGLPPTPIAMPGRAAIEAVLHPAETDALFFVSRGDGSHKFSRTLAEHEAAVVEYQLGGDASRLQRGGDRSADEAGQ